MNVAAALHNGEYYAPMCCQQPTNSALFEEWFEESLLPALPRGESYAIILDNASCRRKAALRKLARGKARILFLTPYSPGCNPIEKSRANMKRWPRDGDHDS